MPINADNQEKGPLQKFKSSFNEIFGKQHENSKLKASRVDEKSAGKGDYHEKQY